MVAQALMPYTIGRAIQDGIVCDDSSALATWALLLLGLGIVQGVGRRDAPPLRRAELAPGRVPPRPGREPPRRARAARRSARGVSTGEVVATVSNDALRAGGAFDITARLSGAIVSYAVVAAILLSTSVVLGPDRPRRRADPRAHARARDPAAPGASARAARGGRSAHRARRRHRGGASRAPRDRRGAGVLRPLPRALAERAARRRRRSRRRSRPSTRPRCCSRASSS